MYRVKGQEWPQLPGLLAATPPKRPARGREEDRLLLYLTLSGNTPFSSSEYNQITNQMAQRFYRTPGSLTSAVRSTAEALNHFLLQRNLRTTSKGQYIIGRLILGVVRGSQFVLTQCGPTHAFQLHDGQTRQMHDAQIAGRGLGFSQTTSAYYSQFEIAAGDLLVLCTNLPSGWDKALLEERGSPVEALRRKLVSISSDDLNAVLVQVQTGKGRLNVLQAPRPAAEQAATPQAGPAGAGGPSVPAPASGGMARRPGPSRPSRQVQSAGPASRFARLLNGQQNQPAPGKAAGVAPTALPAGRPAPAASAGAARPGTQRGKFVSPRASGIALPEIQRPVTVSPRRQSFFRGLTTAIQRLRSGGQKVSMAIRALLPNLLPGVNEGGPEGGSSMAFLAVVVPLVIVTIASVVYGRYGTVTQYQENYARALEQAALARGESDPAEVRRAWESTLYFLERADNYRKTQESQGLRQQAQTALDNMDGILRLDFRQAIIGSLSSSIQISQMAATDTDLYILDSGRGAVSRAFITSQGYEVDSSFSCGPGQYGTTLVGPLIDIEPLRMSNVYNARLLAMDGNGTLLYCGLSDAVAVALVPPQFGWRGIAAFTLDSNGKNLYVLDPPGNAIWQYVGIYGEYTDLPIIFFGEQVPQNMNTAIDLAANSADLYLLFQDGHVTICPQIRYDVAPVRCTDPATFVDTRPERQPGPKITDAIFTRLTFASAPDPSLYMLEPLTRAVYRFSPRSDSMELRGQFRDAIGQNSELSSGTVTAMAMSPNRYLFLSIGNQVYLATDVP